MRIQRTGIVVGLLLAIGWCGSVQAAKKVKTKANATASTESKLAAACLAAEGGKVDVEELNIDRSKYVGTVVKLKFEWINYSSSPPHIYLYGDEYNISVNVTLPDDRDAREWAVDADKDDDSGAVYVYVEASSLLAVGTRSRKGKGGIDYSW
jgi:hypothetical protein